MGKNKKPQKTTSPKDYFNNAIKSLGTDTLKISFKCKCGEEFVIQYSDWKEFENGLIEKLVCPKCEATTGLIPEIKINIETPHIVTYASTLSNRFEWYPYCWPPLGGCGFCWGPTSDFESLDQPCLLCGQCETMLYFSLGCM